MEKVTVVQTLKIVGGVVGLSETQAAIRSHNIEEVEKQPKGMAKGFTAYSLLHELCFKVGEELYLDEVPKPINPLVQVVGSDAAGKDTKAADDKKAAKKASKKAAEGGDNKKAAKKKSKKKAAKK